MGGGWAGKRHWDVFKGYIALNVMGSHHVKLYAAHVCLHPSWTLSRAWNLDQQLLKRRLNAIEKAAHDAGQDTVGCIGCRSCQLP